VTIELDGAAGGVTTVVVTFGWFSFCKIKVDATVATTIATELAATPMTMSMTLVGFGLRRRRLTDLS
jgi:hypothetical protein